MATVRSAWTTPRHRACVSVTGHYLGPTTHILDCVWDHIVPALA
jgi:hypothetical protein